MRSYLYYAVLVLIVIQSVGCSITPMAARRYEIHQYPDKDCFCVEDTPEVEV